jgi:hypothetical protein
MGYYLRRFHGGETDALDRDEMIELAERALALQLELARDVLAFAEVSELPDTHKEKDRRIIRANETLRTLG